MSDNSLEKAFYMIKAIDPQAKCAYLSCKTKEEAWRAARWIQDNNPEIVSLILEKKALIGVVPLIDATWVVFGGKMSLDHITEIYRKVLNEVNPIHSGLAFPELTTGEQEIKLTKKTKPTRSPDEIKEEIKREEKKRVEIKREEKILGPISLILLIGISIPLLFLVWSNRIAHFGILVKLILSWVALVIACIVGFILPVHFFPHARDSFYKDLRKS